MRDLQHGADVLTRDARNGRGKRHSAEVRVAQQQHLLEHAEENLHGGRRLGGVEEHVCIDEAQQGEHHVRAERDKGDARVVLVLVEEAAQPARLEQGLRSV